MNVTLWAAMVSCMNVIKSPDAFFCCSYCVNFPLYISFRALYAVLGWNRGYSARRRDATGGLGVNQLAGGVALPKLLYRAAPSSGFFSDSEFLLLLFIAYIELNFCPTAC